MELNYVILFYKAFWTILFENIVKIQSNYNL